MKKPILRFRKIFIVFLLVLIVGVYRYQITYLSYAYIRPIAGEVTFIVTGLSPWDETFNVLRDRELEYINFWSPSFRYKIFAGVSAGDATFSEYRDKNTIILTSPIQCEPNIIINEVNPDKVVFIPLENSWWGIYKYGDRTYLYDICGVVKDVSDITNYSNWEFMDDTRYFTDQKIIYYWGEPVIGADLDTFQTDFILVGKNSNGSDIYADAKDKNNLYRSGKIIKVR
jgi:hypothetical protein